MKSLLAIIVASMLASALTSRALAQWTVQNSGIPTNDQVVLAAVNQNVCWGVTRATGGRYVTRTTNGGTSWVASNHDSLSPFSSIAAVSADTAWIAASGAIYRTTNGGVNWTQQLTTGPMGIVRFFDSNNGVCIGDGTNGNAEIYTTTNKGTTWTQVQSSNIPFLQSEGFIPDNAVVRGNAIWVPTNGGSSYKSTDRGLTWNVTRPVVNQGTGSFCALKDSLNGLLSSAASNVVKRTTDGGATWTPTGSIPQGVSPLFMCYVPGTNGSYMVTSVNPPGALTGSAYTLNSGATWTTVDNVSHGKAAFVSPSVGWSWGGANIIYKWTGGGVENWTAQASGISTGDQVVLAAVNANVCWGVTRDIGLRWVTRTTNGGTNWTASNLSSLKDFYGIAALNADTAWIAADSAIYKTTNGGVNWTQQLATEMLIIHFFDSNNGVCIGGAFAGPIQVYTTTDRGSIWTPVPSSNIPPGAGGAIPSNYAAVGSTLWCPTNGGSLYKTTDQGTTWSVTQNVGGTSGGVFVAFKDAANGLATASSTVLRTNDGGASWTSTGSVPNGVSAFLLSYVPGTSGSYMITSNPYPIPTRLNGSAYTLDNGATWTTVDNVPHGKAAFVSPSVGWSWGGANVICKWTRPSLSPSTSVRETREIVKDFRLEQNYPNPFNPSTKIGFRVSGSGFVSLKVYDVLGREVRTLVNENLQVGSYETTFDGSSLASGVYLYKLQAGDFLQTKKLMLLR